MTTRSHMTAGGTTVHKEVRPKIRRSRYSWAVQGTDHHDLSSFVEHVACLERQVQDLIIAHVFKIHALQVRMIELARGVHGHESALLHDPNPGAAFLRSK
jgi:hypothetical protein